MADPFMNLPGREHVPRVKFVGDKKQCETQEWGGDGKYTRQKSIMPRRSDGKGFSHVQKHHTSVLPFSLTPMQLNRGFRVCLCTGQPMSSWEPPSIPTALGNTASRGTGTSTSEEQTGDAKHARGSTHFSTSVERGLYRIVRATAASKPELYLRAPALHHTSGAEATPTK